MKTLVPAPAPVFGAETSKKSTGKDERESETKTNSPGLSWPEVVLEDGRRLRSRLLVAADGANSAVRAQSGIGELHCSYRRCPEAPRARSACG